jgi:hypothetical protein
MRASNTLSFVAERVAWDIFTVAPSHDISTLFTFSLREESLPCGFLSVSLDDAFNQATFQRASEANPENKHRWSLVQLYQFELDH